MTQTVLLVNKFYSPSIGGIETAVRQYAHWYREMGYRVIILCCSHTPQKKTVKETIQGIEIIRTASMGNLFSVPISLPFFKYFFQLAPLCNLLHINLQFPWASMAFCLMKKKISGRTIISYHCDVYRQKKLKLITYLFDRKAVRDADTVITGSQILRERSEVLSKIKRTVKILPYSINLLQLDKYLNQQLIPLPDAFCSKGYYIFFGRMVNYKGVRIIEKAFMKLMLENKAVNLLVFGIGPESHRFHNLVKNYPENIIFYNQTFSQQKKYQMLKGAKAFLFPSQYPSEAFGIAQLDAMAMKKTIINTKLPTGVNWAAPDGVCAITIEAGNVKALAEAMQGCEEGKFNLQELGEAGRKRVEDYFDEAVIKKEFFKIVNSTLNKKNFTITDKIH
ncbi:glycosyltransferase [Desulfobotulus mexicanus]|uniref:Glycosyltransferase n=1 Tax=Desulfobotulus mexicanus TaxID=2586642 RepID=A0A5Q4VG93_9BACT|nr:glycosyltransferase [Desulfobotulus mexicanus]TYT75292.1 glycosyltransferase [Desulfobotulus mexicanus]